MGKQHANSGKSNFGMLLETVLECSVVDIGVQGAVGYSPDSPLGLKPTFLAEPLFGIVLNQKELSCPCSCPFPHDCMHQDTEI